MIVAHDDLQVIRSSLCPNSMLYFHIHVLERLLLQFSDTEHSDSYVQQCVSANGRCPASVIALLFYYDCRDLSPCMSVALAATQKQRLHDPGDSWGMPITDFLSCWVCWFKCKCLRPRNCSEPVCREEATSAMQWQNTSEVAATCVFVLMAFQAAARAEPAGSSASEDDAEESGGLNSTAHEWQRARG